MNFGLFFRCQLDRVSSIAAKYIGRPISQLPPVPLMHIPSLDLSMGSYGARNMVAGPTLDLDLDLHPGSSSSSGPGFSFQPLVFSDMDRSLVGENAASAMEELVRLVQTNEPLWTRSPDDGKDMLDLESYNQMFPRANAASKNPSIRTEASRDSRVVIMNALALVDMLMDPVSSSSSFFPCITRTYDYLGCNFHK